MNKIYDQYHYYYNNPHLFNGDCSAFYQHMPTLRLLCHNKTVLELGARYGVSTCAILAAKPHELTSVDLEKKGSIEILEELAREYDIPFTFIVGNDLDVQVYSQFKELFDIVFIDTMHNYEQLRQELAIYAKLANHYLVFHDTVSFGVRDEFPSSTGKQGLLHAITEFLDSSKGEWVEATHYHNCNGLLILRQV